MFNILIVSTNPNGKGGVASVVNMQMIQLKDGCNIYHLSSQSKGTKIAKFGIMLKGLLLLPWILHTKKNDLVHLHGSMHSSFLRKAQFMFISKLMGKKVVHHLHSATVNEYFATRSKLKGKFVCWLMNQYDAMIVLNDYWKSVIRNKTTSNIYPVFNAIEKRTMPAPQKSEKFTIFIIGEVGQRKGTYDILRIAQKLATYEDIEFRIAGGGTDFEKLKTLCTADNLDGMISWLGWIGPEERDQEMANADLFFLPSYHEGMPMAILEAMSAGLPVLSTPVGAISDCVIDGETGYLIQPGDIDGFAQTICTMKKSSEKLKHMAHASSQRADTVFSPERFADNVMSVYEKVLLNG